MDVIFRNPTHIAMRMPFKSPKLYVHGRELHITEINKRHDEWIPADEERVYLDICPRRWDFARFNSA